MRQLRAAGGPLARMARKSRLDLSSRTAHLQRAGRHAPHDDDDDAIQNDAPAAAAPAHPILSLQQLGVFVLPFEQRPFTLLSSPRSPRGPPPAA